MSETVFKNAFGTFHLRRIPHRKKEVLRAWDAADILLLDRLASHKVDLSKGVFILNDTFAALSVSLHSFNPVNCSDSWISHQALRENLNFNGLHDAHFQTMDSLHVPKTTLSVVLVKVPKSMAFFEYQLLRLKPFLDESTVFMVAGMVKYLPRKVWSLLESIVGVTKTSLAVKKAKVIEVGIRLDIVLKENPYPLLWPLENTSFTLLNHANVFAREHLDLGTRFFLNNLPETIGKKKIIDLACGNGVIGLMLAAKNTQCEVLFIDESYMAIASARENMRQLDGQERFGFHCGDGLSKVKKQSADMIVCNPPFHQHHANAETMALTMFAQASRVLNKDGELWIVGNRHLAYHAKLATWFLDVVLVAANKSFVVLKATRPKSDKKPV